MPLSTYLQKNLISHVLRANVAEAGEYQDIYGDIYSVGDVTDFAQPSTIYMALYISAPSQGDSTGTEVNGSGYARRAVSFSAPDTDGTAYNTATLTYTAAGSWGIVKAFGIYDALTAGNLLFFNSFDVPQNVPTGAVIRFDPNSIAFDFGTTVQGGEVTPPVISINTPGDGTTIGPPITVQGNVIDDSEVSVVEVDVGGTGFAIAEGTWNATNKTYSYSHANQATVSDGLVTIVVRAFDVFGNMAEKTILVTLDTAVTGTKASLTGTSYVTANATVVGGGGAVQVSPTDNLQSKITAAPEGTNFVLAAGTYRLAAGTVPKNNQRFSGAGSLTTLLKGSKLLTGFTQTGSTWSLTVPGGINQAPLAGTGPPLSQLSEEVFFDGTRMSRNATSTVGPNQYFIDYPAARVYIGTNPTGHVVELSTARSAFEGSASGVVIENMGISQFANLAGGSSGAVQSQTGTSWKVESCNISNNHGKAVQVGPSGQVINCDITANGQNGLAVTQVDGATILNNRLDNNNVLNFEAGWQGSGIMVRTSVGTVVQGNTMVRTNGYGIEFNLSCKNYSILFNAVSLATNDGIHVASGYEGKIQNNICDNNGLGVPNVNGDGANIHVLNSGSSTTGGATGFIGLEISGNQVGPNGNNGISLTETTNPVPALDGPHDIKDLNIHDNTIRMGGAQRTGAWTTRGNLDVFLASRNVDFIGNVYHLASPGAWWRWNNADNDRTAWQAVAQDTGGQFNFGGTSQQPSVEITAPTPNQVINTFPFVVRGTATAPAGFNRVEVRFDAETTWRPVSGTATWSYSLGTMADGNHSVVARVVDTAGTIDESGSSPFIVQQQVVGSITYVAAAGDIAGFAGDTDQTSTISMAHGICANLITAHSQYANMKVLAMGDQQYQNGELSQYLTYYNTSWGVFRNKTYPCLGNHEWRTSNGGGYYDYWNGQGISSRVPPGGAATRSQGWYAANWGAKWLVISLNSMMETNTAQLSFLDATLAANPTKYKLVFWHHNRYQEPSKPALSSMQGFHTRISGKVDIAVHAHSHCYIRYVLKNGAGGVDNTNGFREFCVGTGGKDSETGSFPVSTNHDTLAMGGFSRKSTLGILFLELNDNGSYKWTFQDYLGAVFDTGTQTITRSLV